MTEVRETGPQRPEYEPKTDRQILGYLIEECGEVLQAAGKIERWGWDSTNPEIDGANSDLRDAEEQTGAVYPLLRQVLSNVHEGETNREWLRRELGNLKGAIAQVEKLLL